MARSINFKIINDVEFNVRQLRRMYNTSAYYTNNVDWILDKFWVGPKQATPNMNKFQDEELAQDVVNNFLEEGMKSERHFIDVLIDGEEKGILKSVEPLHTRSYSGSVRVAGNEELARMVIKALSELSLVFPRVRIEVEDEGHLLFTNLTIRKGKAIPDTKWVPALMRDLVDLSVSNQTTQFNIKDLSTIKYYKPDKQARLDGLKYIVKRLGRELNLKPLKFKDLKSLPFQQWQDVEFYLRNVRLDEFKNYELDEGRLLSGYFGEHWNLVEIDTEGESFRILAEMQKELKEHSENFSIEVF